MDFDDLSVFGLLLCLCYLSLGAFLAPKTIVLAGCIPAADALLILPRGMTVWCRPVGVLPCIAAHVSVYLDECSFLTAFVCYGYNMLK